MSAGRWTVKGGERFGVYYVVDECQAIDSRHAGKRAYRDACRRASYLNQCEKPDEIVEPTLEERVAALEAEVSDLKYRFRIE